MINDISNYFIGSVQGDEGELYIVNKDDGRGTRSSYTKETGSTTSLRGLRMRHSVSFTPLGKQAEMYATIYGLSEEELPVETVSNRPSSCTSSRHVLWWTRLLAGNGRASNIFEKHKRRR